MRVKVKTLADLLKMQPEIDREGNLEFRNNGRIYPQAMFWYCGKWVDVDKKEGDARYWIKDGQTFYLLPEWCSEFKPDQDTMAKPPLGLRPRYIADLDRQREIIDAIGRYGNIGKKIPQVWINELREIHERAGVSIAGIYHVIEE